MYLKYLRKECRTSLFCLVAKCNSLETHTFVRSGMGYRSSYDHEWLGRLYSTHLSATVHEGRSQLWHKNSMWTKWIKGPSIIVNISASVQNHTLIGDTPAPLKVRNQHCSIGHHLTYTFAYLYHKAEVFTMDYIFYIFNWRRHNV